jgi:hypothetical protein
MSGLLLSVGWYTHGVPSYIVSFLKSVKPVAEPLSMFLIAIFISWHAVEQAAEHGGRAGAGVLLAEHAITWILASALIFAAFALV